MRESQTTEGVDYKQKRDTLWVYDTILGKIDWMEMSCLEMAHGPFFLKKNDFNS